MKISVIFGTRPEAIKMAPIVLGLRSHPHLDVKVCVSGQHREMLDQVLHAFGIEPEHDFNLMQKNQSLGALSSRLMLHLDAYLSEVRPDLVLVQGDTATAFAGALSAFYHKIPVGHIEAGLRTYDLHSPWPEEANRVLIGRLAAMHFAPTQDNCDNLLREGCDRESIYITGNTVIDALLLAREKVRVEPPLIPGLSPELMSSDGPPLVLITGHRRENFGAGFESMCQAIAKLAQAFPLTQFVYPVHLNPHVREPVFRILRQPNGDALDNVSLIEPLSYLPFVRLMDRATLILTDSGGIQEEAPSLGKPVLVMRDNTERIEAVRAGTVRIVGTECDDIFRHTQQLLTDPCAYQAMAQAHNPYGDGSTAAAIIEHCHTFLRRTEDAALTQEMSFSGINTTHSSPTLPAISAPFTALS